MRKTAARLLSAIVDAHTPLDGLTDPDTGHPQFLTLDQRDRSLVRAILVTALRFRRTIERTLSAKLDRPLPSGASSLVHILHVGATQILFLDIPDSAAVDLAVSHARGDPRTARFANLVNAVLRSVAREKEAELPRLLTETSEAPDWFSTRLFEAYGQEKTAAILAAHRVESPTDFTVKSDPLHWAEKLGGVVLPTGSVRVERLAGPVPELPGYDDGAWWVQDAAAAIPARLFGRVDGLRVLDLCAAPGGKTAQLAHGGASVTALDISANRLKRLAVNLARLKLDVEIVDADLMTWRPERLFDAVLLDAPCSSTGTVRRHPDIPFTKTPEDIAKLAALQERFLARATQLVKPGGRLVFSNCSLDPVEGEVVVEKFLAENPAFASDPVAPDEIAGVGPYITDRGSIRTTPADLDMGNAALSGLDGFFASRFRRIA